MATVLLKTCAAYFTVITEYGVNCICCNVTFERIVVEQVDSSSINSLDRCVQRICFPLCHMYLEHLPAPEQAQQFLAVLRCGASEKKYIDLHGA